MYFIDRLPNHSTIFQFGTNKRTELEMSFCRPFLKMGLTFLLKVHDCWDKLVEGVCGFGSSRLKSWRTSSDTEGIPGDFPLLTRLVRWLRLSTASSHTEDLPGDFRLLTLPVRTNILMISIMWVSYDVSWICKSGYMARYFCLQAVTVCTHSLFTNVPLW